MVYYMTQRPASPGAMPKSGLLEIRDYDGKQYIPEIGMKAWSRLIYDRELTVSEIRGYELVPGQYTVDLTRAEIDSIIRCLCVACDQADSSVEIDLMCKLHDRFANVLEGRE